MTLPLPYQKLIFDTVLGLLTGGGRTAVKVAGILKRVAKEGLGVLTNLKPLVPNAVRNTGKVLDDAGNYFRIENTNLTGNRRYLDLDGNIPNNKVVDARISGRSTAEYNQVTLDNVD